MLTIVQLVGYILIPFLINMYPNCIAWLHVLIFIGIFGSIFFFINATWTIWIGTVIHGFVLSGLIPIGLMLPLDEVKNIKEANEWSSIVLSGGFIMSANVPLLIGFVFDLIAGHFWTKCIFVIGCFRKLCCFG